MVVLGFYDEARTNSIVAPKEVIGKVESEKQQTELMVDRKTLQEMVKLIQWIL